MSDAPAPLSRAKRGFDVVAAFLLLVLLLPLLLLLALLTLLTQGLPVFFRQERGGHLGRTFRLLKFRTMRPGEGPDAERLTRFGRFLRATSLDELPELWNVLRGDMSLVGPRPLLARYLERYSPEQARRHLVRPGLTGWAQLHGRNALSWEEKFRLDVWYVDHRSFWLDLVILLRTPALVFSRKGVRSASHESMEEFLGSPPPRPPSESP